MPPDPAPGTTHQRGAGGEALLAGRYALEAVLGRGGMAEVYRATDQLLHREVAVKVLRDSADSDTDRDRFTAEARTLAQLSHSGLVMVLDAGVTARAEQPYLVMELVEGPTLAQEMDAGRLGADRLRVIGVQLAEALGYVHGSGVVHRDVKPGNVLLGRDQRVKLADFGIARLIGDTVRHTRTGQAIGTAAYLAPEQVAGRDVDGCADIYSLGLVLLEALTGERAFPGPATEAAVARLSRDPHVPPDLPSDWRALLTRMTAQDPASRPSAHEVATALRTAPTGPIPVATVREVPEPADHEPADRTWQLTESATVAVPSPPERPTRTRPPLVDRAGDAVSTAARRGVRRARSLQPHQLGVLAALACLVLLIFAVALAAGTGGDDTDRLPANTPAQLREPLADLHDAVEGGG